MENYELQAKAMLDKINRILCYTCTRDKTDIHLAIMECKSNLDTLRRHNSITGKTENFEDLSQVKFWIQVKEHLKAMV